MKRLLVIIISLALQSCASSRAGHRTYCEPTQDIELIETDYLGTGMDKSTYEFNRLDETPEDFMLRKEDTPFNRFYNEIIIRGLEQKEDE